MDSGARPVAAPRALVLGLLVATLSGALVTVTTTGAVPAWLLAAVGGSAALAVGGFLLWRSMGAFICLVLAVRPLVDLGAEARGGGVSITEIFGLGVLLACSAWLVMNRHALVDRLRNRLAMALLTLAAVYALAAIGSASPGNSGPFLLRLATGVALFLVLDLLLARGSLRFEHLVVAVGAAGAIALGYACLGFFGVPVTHMKDDVAALKSVFHLSNNYAHFLVPFVLVSFAWTVRTTGRSRWWAAAAFVATTAQLVLTQTRGAWLAAVVGLVVAALLTRRRAMLAVVAAALVALAFLPPVNARITSLTPSPDQVRTESSLAWRLGHWGELLPLVSTSPVLGIGPDESARLLGKEPHNDVLRALVEAGVVGFVAFLWFMWETVRVAGRAVRRTAAPVPRSLGTGPPGALDATVVGMAAYVGAFCVAVLGENLIDNVTMLGVLMPLLALLRWTAELPEGSAAPPKRTGERLVDG